MRRTIYGDPRRVQRKIRRDTRKVLPSNFQFGLRDKGEELRLRRSSDGRLEQMVEVEEYSGLQSNVSLAQQQIIEDRETMAELREQIEELQEIVDSLL